MQKKNIIVVGYPKSGNTWITRLVAELLQCPVAGFWNLDHGELAIEGQDRVSEYQCFKSHYQFHELRLEADHSNNFLIYVIRDPRDIAISGANYFYFNRFKQWNDHFFLKYVNTFLNKFFYKVVNPESYRIDAMIDTILHGSEETNYWCRVPWKEHFTTYFDQKTFFVKYEDMLSSPQTTCRNILDYLNFYRHDRAIEAAIEKQSFERKKQEFIQKGDQWRASFMRTGKSQQWKEKLSAHQKLIVEYHLRKELVLFGYEV